MDKHWKERLPEETILIIKNFFSANKYTIHLWGNEITESGSWHCAVSLYKDNQFILQANGKGMTELYSQASAYAELYERFCNKTNFIRIPSFIKSYTELQEKTNGYKFHPKEKQLNYEDILKVPNMLEQLTIFLHNSNNITRYLDFLTDKNPIGEPYINLDTKEIAYYDPRLVHFIQASNGQAAGNTIEEALNQGLSELTERMAEKKFFEEEQEMYYLIDLNSINNKELQEKISNIQAAGNKIYIFDLSYNFHLPTIMSVIINDLGKCTNMNFGSFPVFDIAVERTITEMYQGSTTINNWLNIQIPYRSNQYYMKEFKNSISGCSYLNEKCFTQNTIVSQPSSTFLTNQSITNQELNDYFINLFNSMNLPIYYINHGLTEEMAAIQIFIPNYTFLTKDEILYKNFSNILIDEGLKVIEYQKEIIENIIEGNYSSIKHLIEQITFLIDKKSYDGVYVGKLIFTDGLHLLPLKNEATHTIFVLNGAQSMYNYYAIYRNPLQKIYLLNQYIDSQKYTKEEIFTIFDKMFSISLTDDDYRNYKTKDYVINELLIAPTHEYYYSQSYLDILNSFILKGKND